MAASVSCGVLVTDGPHVLLGHATRTPRWDIPKGLALFAWRVPAMPDPTVLRCASMVSRPGQAPFPELDRFAILPWNEALERVGRNMARVLALVRPQLAP